MTALDLFECAASDDGLAKCKVGPSSSRNVAGRMIIARSTTFSARGRFRHECICSAPITAGNTREPRFNARWRRLTKNHTSRGMYRALRSGGVRRERHRGGNRGPPSVLRTAAPRSRRGSDHPHVHSAWFARSDARTAPPAEPAAVWPARRSAVADFVEKQRSAAPAESSAPHRHRAVNARVRDRTAPFR